MREAFAARAGPAVKIVLILPLVVLLAVNIPTRPALALGVAVVLLVVGFALAAPRLLLATAFAAVVAWWRVGPSLLVNISVCDVATVLALLAALPYVPWRSRALRRILVGLAVYLALISIPLAAHATNAAITEWFHRGFLVGGAVLIGAAVAHRRETALALRAFIFADAIVATAAVYESVTTGLQPAFPFGMHKNAAGAFLAIGIIVLIVAPRRPELSAVTTRYIRALLVVGLVATQSRGAALALVAVIAIYTLRHRSARQRAPIFFLLISVALIVGSVVTLKDEFKSNPKFNAIDTRTDAFDIAINDAWLPHPLTGAGLRWFQENDAFNPGVHNEVIAELSEVGLIGLLGLVVLAVSIFRALRRRRDPMGEVGILVFAFLLLFGLTEILWAAGTLTVTMLLVGLAAGEEPARRVGRNEDAVVPARS